MNVTSQDILIVIGGAVVVFIVAFLVIRFTKYGGGSNYGMTGDSDMTADRWDSEDFDL